MQRKTIFDIADKEPLILNLPEPTARMASQGESAINVGAKFWCKKADYWTVVFNMNEAVKKAFDENKIEIPFNQLEVYVKND